MQPRCHAHRNRLISSVRSFFGVQGQPGHQLCVDTREIDFVAFALIVALVVVALPCAVDSVHAPLAGDALKHAVLLATAGVVQLQNKDLTELVLLAERIKDMERAFEERRWVEFVRSERRAGRGFSRTGLLADEWRLAQLDVV